MVNSVEFKTINRFALFDMGHGVKHDVTSPAGKVSVLITASVSEQ